MVRLQTQAEEQINCNSSIVEGLGKRHPTVLVGRLSTTPPADCVGHWINRDDNEKYSVSIDTQGNITVLDLLRQEVRSVSYPDGKAYITSATPKEDLAFLTVEDYTFITNKRVMVSPSGKPPQSTIQYRNLIFGALSRGDYSFKYTVTCGSNTVDFFYGPAPKRVGYLNPKLASMGVTATSAKPLVASSLNELVSLVASVFSALMPTFTVRPEGGNTVAFYAPDSSTAVPALSWTIMRTDNGSTAYGGWLTTAAGTTSSVGALAGTKQLFSALPASATVGDLWKIQGDPNNEFSAYYVKWNGAAWEETTAPGNSIGLDPATMPHVLIRQADGTFAFKAATWELRKVGDVNSNPDPGFVGSQVRDLVFYRNRLGFVSAVGTSFSRSGEYFNFYRTSVTTLLDTDPIDAQAASTKAAQLNYAVPFSKQLLLFTDQAQLSLSSTDTFTPKAVSSFNQATEYECSSRAKPVLAGPMLYFVADRGKFSQVWEYYVEQYTQANKADDVTAHIPSYIPGGVFKLCSSPTEDLLVALSSQYRNSMYTYRFYWKADQKAQAAWSRWEFADEDKVEDCTMLGSILYLLISRPSGLYVEGIDMHPAKIETDLPFLIHLDRKILSQGTYDGLTGLTTWSLPYTSQVAPVAVRPGSAGSRAGSFITTQFTAGSSQLTAVGDYTAAPVYIGIPYTARYEFTKQFVRDQQGLAIASADLRLRTFSVYYANTGEFRSEVTPLARDTSVKVMTGRQLGTPSATLGTPSLGSGVFRFSVMSDAQTVRVALINDSYLPSFWQNAEWEGVAAMRARRQ